MTEQSPGGPGQPQYQGAGNPSESQSDYAPQQYQQPHPQQGNPQQGRQQGSYQPGHQSQQLVRGVRLIVGDEPASFVASGSGRPGVAGVYAARDGSIVGPEGKPTTVGERMAIRRRYLVDVSDKRSKLTFRLPAQGAVFLFDAEVNVNWWVDRPWIVVQRNIQDGEELLRSRLQALMRPIAAKFEPRQSQLAEEQLNLRFGARQGHLPEGVAIRECFVMLSIDDKLRQPILEGQVNEVRLQAVHRAMEGDPSGVAMYVANNPQDIKTVIEMVSKNREVDQDTRFRLLQLLENNGALQDVDLVDVRRQLLGTLGQLSAGVNGHQIGAGPSGDGRSGPPPVPGSRPGPVRPQRYEPPPADRSDPDDYDLP